MTKIRNVVSVLLAALFTAGVMTIGPAAAENKKESQSTSVCVRTVDFDNLSDKERHQLYGRK